MEVNRGEGDFENFARRRSVLLHNAFIEDSLMIEGFLHSSKTLNLEKSCRYRKSHVRSPYNIFVFYLLLMFSNTGFSTANVNEAF